MWGNPWSHKAGTKAAFKVATKAQALSEHRKWVLSDPELIELIKKELKGKILGCWCKPGTCHGDILAKVANESEHEFF